MKVATGLAIALTRLIGDFVSLSPGGGLLTQDSACSEGSVALSLLVDRMVSCRHVSK